MRPQRRSDGVSVRWQTYYSTATVAHHAGYVTSKIICDHCGEYTSCHRGHCGTVRCIACEEG